MKIKLKFEIITISLHSSLYTLATCELSIIMLSCIEEYENGTFGYLPPKKKSTSPRSKSPRSRTILEKNMELVVPDSLRKLSEIKRAVMMMTRKREKFYNEKIEKLFRCLDLVKKRKRSPERLIEVYGKYCKILNSEKWYVPSEKLISKIAEFSETLQKLDKEIHEEQEEQELNEFIHGDSEPEVDPELEEFIR